MWRTTLFGLLGLWSVVAQAQESRYICWVRSASLSDAGEAVVKFEADARASMVTISAGANRPDTRFSLGPENTGSNGGNSTVTLPKGKEAWLRQGHEACEFRWAEEGGRPGIRISATSSYFPPGGAPSTAHVFVPFSK